MKEERTERMMGRMRRRRMRRRRKNLRSLSLQCRVEYKNAVAELSMNTVRVREM